MMSRPVLTFALLAATLGLTACASNTTVSCTTTTSIMTSTGTTSNVTCSEGQTDDVNGARMGCVVTGPDGGPVGDAGGVTNTDMFLAGPCPRTGAVGGCSANGSTQWFYAGSTAASVQAQGGTFLMP